MLDPQRGFTLGLLARLGLDHCRVNALVDQAAPFACGLPRLLQRDRAIGADDAPGRCCASSEPRKQDEADAPGLAASRRVGIDGVADADSEAGKACVEHFDALAARCRWQWLQVSVGNQSAVGQGSCSGSWATAGLQIHRSPVRIRENVCARYNRNNPIAEGFMRIYAIIWKWLKMPYASLFDN